MDTAGAQIKLTGKGIKKVSFLLKRPDDDSLVLQLYGEPTIELNIALKIFKPTIKTYLENINQSLFDYFEQQLSKEDVNLTALNAYLNQGRLVLRFK